MTYRLDVYHRTPGIVLPPISSPMLSPWCLRLACARARGPAAQLRAKRFLRLEIPPSCRSSAISVFRLATGVANRYYLDVKNRIGIKGSIQNIPDGYLLDLSVPSPASTLSRMSLSRTIHSDTSPSRFFSSQKPKSGIKVGILALLICRFRWAAPRV